MSINGQSEFLQNGTVSKLLGVLSRIQVQNSKKPADELLGVLFLLVLGRGNAELMNMTDCAKRRGA